MRFSQSCIDWLQGAIFQELKRSEREANRILAYSAGVESEWLRTFMPHMPSYAKISNLYLYKATLLTLIRECFKTIAVNRVATFLFRQNRGNLKAPHYR